MGLNTAEFKRNWRIERRKSNDVWRNLRDRRVAGSFVSARIYLWLFFHIRAASGSWSRARELEGVRERERPCGYCSSRERGITRTVFLMSPHGSRRIYFRNRGVSLVEYLHPVFHRADHTHPRARTDLQSSIAPFSNSYRESRVSVRR